MYHASVPRALIRSRGGTLVLAAAVLLAPAAGAQMIGAPVLQNAFSNPGITVAVNYSGGTNHKVIAGAGAWAPASGRFQLSAGGGVLSPDSGDSELDYGGRLAIPLRSFGPAFGLAVFAGAGVVKLGDTRIMQVPAGLGLGYRRRLGETRGISVYATPFYSWSRTTGDTPVRSGLFRAGAGVDVSLTRAIGATIGIEAGAKADPGKPGATGTLWGVGLSYAFH